MIKVFIQELFFSFLQKLLSLFKSYNERWYFDKYRYGKSLLLLKHMKKLKLWNFNLYFLQNSNELTTCLQ